ncbi:hypothetical protein ACRALDRAFT_204816 [Sodiomyces alcalophilus JCM 7366]|uniref:uncharacterized protein n=1 Tax=Sodiomyces alcalophilus JCM 7366 TaxID=591952 RepID=UPI0039B5FC14
MCVYKTKDATGVCLEEESRLSAINGTAGWEDLDRPFTSHLASNRHGTSCSGPDMRPIGM